MGALSVKKPLLVLLAAFWLMSTVCAQNKPVRLPGIPYPLNWENSPLNYSLKGSVLSIDAGPKTDMFRDPNVTYNTDNAPKLLLTADNDFVLTTRIEHAFTYKWDGGAIVLKT